MEAEIYTNDRHWVGSIGRTLLRSSTISDDLLMTDLAEYRLLTVRQLAALQQKRERTIQKRVNKLLKQDLVQCLSRGCISKRGRPEQVISLTENAVRKLRAMETLVLSRSARHVLAEGVPREHQLLVNWFRVCLVNGVRIVPEISVQFLAPTSPFLERGDDDLPTISDQVEAPSGEIVRFIPDGVFILGDRDQGKTILFFLEVDMGTEPLTSARGRRNDVAQKLFNYKTYYHSERYKRYEHRWQCRFRGFRLLLLASTADRCAALCRLVRDCEPADFIWLTDQSKLLAQGATAKIWMRGGHVEEPPRSVFGSRAPDAATGSPVV